MNLKWKKRKQANCKKMKVDLLTSIFFLYKQYTGTPGDWPAGEWKGNLDMSLNWEKEP